MQYLNILAGGLETSHVSYLDDCHSLPCTLNSNNIALAVVDAVSSLGVKRNCFCLLLFDAAKYCI